MGASKDEKSKHKKHKKKERKEKHKKKDGKRGKERSSRRGSDSSASSDGGGARVSAAAQVAQGRVAVRAAREILAYNYELRNDLRELARQLDSGGALDISGIPDDFLRVRLSVLFDSLPQLRRTAAGQHRRRDGAAAVLSFLAPLLEESPASLATYARPVEAANAPAQPAAAREAPQGAAAAGPAAAAPAATATATAAAQAEGGSGGGSARAPAKVIGPASGPPPAAAAAAAHGREEEGLAGSSGGSEGEGGGAPRAAARRTLGPAMPPPEVLAAAAAIAPAEDYGGPEEEEEQGGDFVVGPPPPELEEEVELASMDERSAEVVRVLRVLRDHAAASGAALAAPAAAGAAPAPRPPDAYAVLGAAPSDPGPAIKKRYWRLSLLIHPDKCAHEQAATAFQAVAAAAAELQDAAARAAVDERREEAALRRAAAAHAAQEERARQWRVARGEATPQDLEGPAGGGGGPAARDAWMTELPPEATVRQGPPQGNVTTFSAAGIRARGDTSAWTSTPQERALRIEGGGGGGGAGPALLMAAAAEGAWQQRTAAVVDAYNANARGKTLLEAHQERQAGANKRDKKEKREKKRKAAGPAEGGAAAGPAGAAAAGDDWDRAAHPWRPFDREKDLDSGPPKASNPREMLNSLPALGSRFAGTQGGGRSFL